MRSQKRGRTKLLNGEDDDPMSGMANLFDVSMVFAVALMVALVQRLHMTEFFSESSFTMVKNPGKENMQIIEKKDGEIIEYKASKNSKQTSEDGNGKKVGIAYQLENGEVIYVPE